MARLSRHFLPVAVVAAAGLALAPAPASAAAAKRPTAATAPTRTLEAGGARIGYRSFGTGRPVVFVQGLSGTMDAWDPRFLDAVAAGGRRIVLLDNEGMGKSELRAGDLSIRRMADNTAALMRGLKLRGADVFGWSMGGMIAQSLAVRHPSLVRRLVLAASAPGDGKSTPPTERGLKALSTPGGSPTEALGLLFPPSASAAQGAYLSNLGKRRNAKPTGPGATIAKQIAASGTWLVGKDPDGKRVGKLRIPVLVGGGALDDLLPAGNQRHLGKTIPNAKTVIYDDASHGFFLHKRADFLPRLRRFLGR